MAYSIRKLLHDLYNVISRYFGGAVLCAQSSINGRLGAKVGVLESSWLTFVLGALVSFLIAFFLEPNHALNLFTAPRWQLTGAFLACLYAYDCICYA